MPQKFIDKLYLSPFEQAIPNKVKEFKELKEFLQPVSGKHKQSYGDLNDKLISIIGEDYARLETVQITEDHIKRMQLYKKSYEILCLINIIIISQRIKKLKVDKPSGIYAQRDKIIDYMTVENTFKLQNDKIINGIHEKLITKGTGEDVVNLYDKVYSLYKQVNNNNFEEVDLIFQAICLSLFCAGYATVGLLILMSTIPTGAPGLGVLLMSGYFAPPMAAAYLTIKHFIEADDVNKEAEDIKGKFSNFFQEGSDINLTKEKLAALETFSTVAASNA